MAHRFLSLITCTCSLLASALGERCEIRVIDRTTEWPVPLVTLTTTSNARFITDNAGKIAFDLPEFMGRETWFAVESPGYTVAADGFGNRGVRLTPKPGARLTIQVTRTAIAKRLGRLTGAGLFSESQQLGEERSWPESGITGCDSVQNALHNGKLFWAWGDTNVPHYPLGHFHMTGATTHPQALTSFEPPLKLSLDYFQDDHGHVRSICQMEGDGPTWLSGLVSLPHADGTPRLVGTYVKIRPPLEAYRAGLAVWNETTQQFDHLRDVWEPTASDPHKPLHLPEGHVTLWKDDEGIPWALFGDPFPHLKCRADFDHWADPDQWKSLEPQTHVPTQDGSQRIEPHRGSIAWSRHRNCWVTIFTQKFGESSALGEIWYAEAPTPIGPWANAVKVLSHHHYTFYNPRLHPHLTAETPNILLFEGTYTKTFSKTSTPTAKYDYNQVLYRIDLDDPALHPRR